MRINATEQTSTFPVPLNKLKGRLMDEIGRKWETTHGTFEINKNTVDWIVKNARTSMYTTERSYIYNKAFAQMLTQYNLQDYADMLDERAKATNGKSNKRGMTWNKDYLKTNNQFQLIRDWAGERGLYTKGDTKTQFCKLMEEAGELGRAVLKNDQAEFEDAIGDMVVVLTNLAHLGGTTIEDCINGAYEVISKRTGKMVNGTFVKDDK